MLNKKLVYYIDMDGVLFDFNGEPNAMELFRVQVGFFARLKPIVPNLLAVKTLIKKGYKVRILSASPNEQADQDKLFSLAKHLPELKSKHIIICRVGDVKADYVKKIENSVLFDDYGKNCREWRANGGVAHKVKDNRMMFRMACES